MGEGRSGLKRGKFKAYSLNVLAFGSFARHAAVRLL